MKKSAFRMRVGWAMAACALAILFAGASCEKDKTHAKKVIVLGMDGMDPRLCQRMMDRGELPNLKKLAETGSFQPLGTSIPPQSPVAWSSFITGSNPGVHGIFDFIHRKPEKQTEPYYSAADTRGSDEGWVVGDYKIPLTFWPFNHQAPETKLLREGKPFWDYLDEIGVPMWIYDIPANYPPSPSHEGHMCCLAGMGAPDLRGGYGTYQYFAEDVEYFSDNESGGERTPLIFENNVATSTLRGVQNPYYHPQGGNQSRAERPGAPEWAEVEFTVVRDPKSPTARIEVEDQVIVLKEGEWSDWVKVDFAAELPSLLPDMHISGIGRFYVQEVRPNFRLYVTPFNIDPSDPFMPITEPESFLPEISSKLGLFYTAGFQEDHKALSNNVFTDAEYRDQAGFVLKERLELLDYALERYEGGLLFFYFSSTDLQAHMFWWDSDDPHPVRTPEDAKIYNGAIEDVYREMDKVVGRVVDQYGDDATIMVMSDHGFCNFRRQVNLNAWLRDNGYLVPYDKSKASSVVFHPSNPIDWNETRAYALGLNGLYINLLGRERDGIVDPADRDALLDEISAKLLQLTDPEVGEPVVAKVYRSDEVYSGPRVKDAPDLIVGFHRGYRASWGNTLGGVSTWTFKDNNSEWSADHCVAAEEVPGVIFSNRPIVRSSPSLVDMAPTVLKEFGREVPDTMEGGSLFEARKESQQLATKEQ